MSLQKIVAEIETLESCWHKLLFIVGLAIAEDKKLANTLFIPYVNVSLLVSEKLQELPKTSYPLKVGEVLNDHLSSYSVPILWLGNIEILFDQQLQQHPVRLLEQLSKRFNLLVSWPGEYKGNALIYATPEHPEYFKCSEFEGKIITV
ncbi:BREX-3 system P-loop-containing protein BrxF [Anoxybacillus rupiensis]|uniref:BREX-3 system P-loop-containing protein BrxF n=1 Tax=Anoxybacteroides rupiense TaxID=311460 RepID=A0ABT5VYV1_9BACL|nr:BREX-3 system P-loop-containing protein BrxF [Anoxybacillus rupiensis]MBB3906536.1 hypothetical protein [Anoxybacillus rupiensis]MDE8562278.1 BREX-3 system P-loop-containing protein BrxF [Anoxybacillus rupiensis]